MRLIKKVTKFVLLSVLILSVIGIGTTYYTFIYIPEANYKDAIVSGPFDAIIVPGIPFDGNNWNKIMEARVKWACHLYSKGISKNIIFSGGAVYTPYVESKVMALYASEMGIPRERIFTETKAEHSTENLYYSYHLAIKKGFIKIALATDPFQTAILWNFIDNVDSNIHTIPIKFDIINKIPEKSFTIDATSTKVKDFVSLVVRESKFERFKGTMGKKIKYEKK